MKFGSIVMYAAPLPLFERSIHSVRYPLTVLHKHISGMNLDLVVYENSCFKKETSVGNNSSKIISQQPALSRGLRS